ncbi:MAG: hypothetical protein HY690_02940 [Chloroflexi bacterium]|nr:hypothetical protein [Chloroflexota bacterium]
MATITLAQAIEQEQQAQQREQDAGREVQRREHELAELNRAFDVAPPDPSTLARLVSQRDGLELVLARLRGRALELTRQRERAATVRGDVEMVIVGLHHGIADAENQVATSAAAIRDAEGELAARRRRHAASEEKLAARRTSLALLMAGA